MGFGTSIAKKLGFMNSETYFNYPNEPIGGGNPYWRCSSCKRSDPEINGQLTRHLENCDFRKSIELKLTTKTISNTDIDKIEKYVRETGYCSAYSPSHFVVHNDTNPSCNCSGTRIADDAREILEIIGR